MNFRLKTLLVRVSILMVLLSAPLLSYSQIGDPGGDPDVPLTGIEWLLVAGGSLGLRKIYKNYRHRNL